MAADRSAELLESLPPNLATDLQPHVGALASAIIREIQQTVPAYSQPLVGGFGKFLKQGVEIGILRCVERTGNPDASDEQWLALFRNLGRMEFVEGRAVETFQAAARAGGRAAWRYLSLVLQRSGVSTIVLSILAEAIFAYVDELCATALEGYYEARDRAHGVPDLYRRQLLAYIATAAPTATISGAAKAAGWAVPERVAMVALLPGPEARKFAAELLVDEVLVDLEDCGPYLLTADPKRHLSVFDGCWRGWRAAISPMVALRDAPEALRTARRALPLLCRDSSDDVIWCHDHLATLWLLAEDFLAVELAKRALDPFDGLSEKQRGRLSETLLTWLETRGGAPEIAKRLNVHPQTVRARLHQLDELFGDRLDDPDARLDMQLALRAQRLNREA